MKTILITGSNRGIGLELVRQYLEQPDTRIFATCRKPDEAIALQALAQDHPDRLTIIPLEVADVGSVQAAAEVVAAQTSSLDVLINNAGMSGPKGETLATLDAELVLNVMRVNTVGPLLVAQAFAALLAKGTTAKLINVSSQMGSLQWRPSSNYSYRVSKAGLNMATRCLAMDLVSRGITTITLHPGWVQTDMGGPNATLTSEESVRSIINLVARLTPADNGEFFNWDGMPHPW